MSIFTWVSENWMAIAATFAAFVTFFQLLAGLTKNATMGTISGFLNKISLFLSAQTPQNK